MRPATSSVVRPTPAAASRSNAAATDDVAPRTASAAGPEREPGEERGRQPAPPDERDGHRDARDAARAEGSVEIAGGRAAAAEDADGEDDVEHVESADCERLDTEQPDERARPRLPCDDA